MGASRSLVHVDLRNNKVGGACAPHVARIVAESGSICTLGTWQRGCPTRARTGVNNTFSDSLR
jgi:hypothetical protein